VAPISPEMKKANMKKAVKAIQMLTGKSTKKSPSP
jgi:hypothetical protein